VAPFDPQHRPESAAEAALLGRQPGGIRMALLP
jgi:hypothetical protein